MSRRSRISNPFKVLLVLVLLAATVAISAGDASADDKQIEYTFRFVNGVTISGTSTDKVQFLPDAGGASVDNPTGMEVHLSCSDKFEDGWGEKDGPDRDVDTAWQIEQFYIVKDDKTCGTPFPVVPPSVDIEKYVNDLDADDPTGPELEVGSTAVFSYVVTNTGESMLTDVAVEDNIAGAITCPLDTLDGGQSMECTSTTMTVEEGQQTMKATVTANGEGISPQPPVPDEKGYGYVFEFRNGVTLSGVSEDNVVYLPDAGGDSVERPTGMEAHISCSDDYPDGWGEKDGPIEGVDTAWQLASYTIVKYKDAGEVDKTCSDRFAPAAPQVVMDMDPVFYLGVVTSEPSITIVKTVNGEDANTPPGPSFTIGDPILIEYVVTNDGNVPLSNIVVIDVTLGERDCEKTELDPGESMSCDSYEVPASAGTGPHGMEASVSGDFEDQVVRDDDPVFFVIVAPADPCIDIEKTVNGFDADEAPGPHFSVGDTLTFEYEVVNCGNVTVRDIMVLDLDLGFRDCPKSELSPGESMTCQRATAPAPDGFTTMHATVTGLVPGDKVYDVDPVNFFAGS